MNVLFARDILSAAIEDTRLSRASLAVLAEIIHGKLKGATPDKDISIDGTRAALLEHALSRLIAVLIFDDVASEGQIARVTNIDRLSVRKLRDDGRASLEQHPIDGAWGSAVMRRMRPSGELSPLTDGDKSDPADAP